MADAVTLSRPGAPRGPRRTAPHLFVLLDAGRPRAGAARICLRRLDLIRIGRAPQRSLASSEQAGVRELALGLADGLVSGAHARLSRVLDAWVLEDAGSKNGTWVGGRRVERAELRDGDLLEVGDTFLLFRSALAHVPDAPEAVELPAPAAGELATLLPAFAAELARLETVAVSPVPVVLLGETGTGKELAARRVHRASGRPGPFVAVNCGALAAELIESELFGHRKGAFTGALEERPGLVRAADHGTLFLDEVGDLPLPAQAALLRVLQEGEVLPVGETRPVPVDLRLVCATHRDLEAMVEAERFRRDLWSRLAGFTLRLPPLRERREDLGLLIGALLRPAPGAEDPPQLTADAARSLLLHSWPLNARELERALATAAALARGRRIELDDLPEAVRASRPAAQGQEASAGAPPAASPSPTEPTPPPPLREPDRQRREQLDALLREHHGNVTAVAKVLGKARTQVQRWMRRTGLDPESFRR